MTEWPDLADRVLVATQQGALGETVTFTPAGGAPAQVRGIFDAEHEEVELQGGVPVSSTAPRVAFRLADLPTAPARGDSVIARSVTYVVVDKQPDGQGGVVLKLHEKPS